MQTKLIPALRSLPLLAAFVAFLPSSFAAEADDMATATGTWRWTFAMPDGGSVKPKLKLKQDGAKLTGTNSFRAGTETPILEGKVAGDEISFQVVREREGAKVITRYTGRRTGDLLKGKIESNWNGETQSYDWEARRDREPKEVVWRWTSTIGGEQTERYLKLKLDGEKASGKLGTVGSRGRGEHDLKNGHLKDGELSFEIETTRVGEKVVMKFQGKLEGDAIDGEVTSHWADRDHRADWKARRGEENK